MSKEHLNETEALPGAEAPSIAPCLVRAPEKPEGQAAGSRRPYEPPRILGEVSLESGGPVLQGSVKIEMTSVQTAGQGLDDYNPGSEFNASWGE